MKSKRLRFFLFHLAISVIVILMIISLVFLMWYPNPLAKAVGVTHIFLILFAIDIVLGPLLTLIVYKDGKKSLKFDLTVVIVIQMFALTYGIYTIAQGRPVWIVFTNQRFELVRNNEIVWEHIENTRLEFQKTLFSKPQYAAVKYENDNIQKNNDIFTEVMGGVSLSQFPERYQSLDQVKNKITHQANHLTKLNDFNEKKQVEKIITKYPQATAWLPLKANTMDMVVLINREKGEVVKIVDLRPWK